MRRVCKEIHFRRLDPERFGCWLADERSLMGM